MLHADQANNANWGFEAIEAPMAWGCTTGDSSVQIGVVDRGFFNVDDLQPNVSSSGGAALGADTIYHGTSVASIIGARGDNGIGMTGMLWNVALELSDYVSRDTVLSEPYRPFAALQAMAANGVSIINFSSGFSWLDIKNRLPQNTKADSNTARLIGATMHEAISGPLVANTLFIISAANDGIDAWWSGVAQVADSADVSGRVLVVAGLDSAIQLFSFGTGNYGSNRNITHSLVSVAAPGRDVGALDSSQAANVVRVTGTSFAAPFVTGVAGLLKAFNPNLTASEIRTLILVGAQRDGRTAGNIPVINAYESIRAAAERLGGPLCGNRVWVGEGHKITVRRTATQTEVLTTVSDTVWGITPMHGGRRLDYTTPSGIFALQWNASTGSWQTGSTSSSDSIPSGIVRSIHGMSHDGDSLATVVPPSHINESQTLQVPVRISYQGGTPVQVGTVPVTSKEWTPSGGSPDVCRARGASGTCLEGYGWSKLPTKQNFRVALAPSAGHVYVAVNNFRDVVLPQDTMPWHPCSVQLGDSVATECRPVVYQWVSDGADIYDVAPNGSRTKLKSLSETVFWLGVGEDDNTVVYAVGNYYMQGFDGIDSDSSAFFTEDCQVEYRDRSLATLLEYESTEETCLNWVRTGSVIPGERIGGGAISALKADKHAVVLGDFPNAPAWPGGTVVSKALFFPHDSRVAPPGAP